LEKENEFAEANLFGLFDAGLSLEIFRVPNSRRSERDSKLVVDNHRLRKRQAKGFNG
jgi:hypothetical protein